MGVPRPSQSSDQATSDSHLPPLLTMTFDGNSGWDGGEGGEGGASWWMVTSVLVKPDPPQSALHVARPCGGEDESLELMYALTLQVLSPSRLLIAVVLGASASNIQAAGTLLPPRQSGSQYSQEEAPSAL